MTTTDLPSAQAELLFTAYVKAVEIRLLNQAAPVVAARLGRNILKKVKFAIDF